MGKRGRGKSPNIKNGVQAAILYVKMVYGDWSANRIRKYLLDHHGNFNLKKSDIPVTRSIPNVIKRNQSTLTDMQVVTNSETFKDLESPWHMGTLDKHPLPPETIPFIFALRQWGEENPENVFGLTTRPLKAFTVRQAIWAARHYNIGRYFLQQATKDKKKKRFNPYSWAWQWSEAYAQYEILCKLSGKSPLDTTELDKAMWSGALPLSMINAVDLYFPSDNVEEAIFINPDSPNLDSIDFNKDGEA